jgi:hypothetical protein
MQKYVRPKRLAGNKHALVRIPGSWVPLPRNGGWVTLDEYWSRRLRDGDVEETDPPKEGEEPTEDEEEATTEAASEAVNPDPPTETADKRRGR